MADTVLVRLKRDWFSPDGSLYEVRHNPHEFPAEWAEEPTKRKDEDADKFAARKKASKFEVLPSTAEVVGSGKTVATLRNTANGEQMIVAEAVEGDVKSVGGALNDRGFEEPSQSTSEAASAAEDLHAEVGGKPRESNPAGGMPGGKKK